MVKRRRKRKPPENLKQELLLRSGYCCSYCYESFGIPYVNTRGKKTTTCAVFDHFLPYNFNGRNELNNWIVSCNICNSIKASHVFHGFNEAKQYITERRCRLGYKPLLSNESTGSPGSTRYAPISQPVSYRTKRIRKLIKEGISKTEICTKLGIAYQTLQSSINADYTRRKQKFAKTKRRSALSLKLMIPTR